MSAENSVNLLSDAFAMRNADISSEYCMTMYERILTDLYDNTALFTQRRLVVNQEIEEFACGIVRGPYPHIYYIED